jgi:hypothetical protein
VIGALAVLGSHEVWARLDRRGDNRSRLASLARMSRSAAILARGRSG